MTSLQQRRGLGSVIKRQQNKLTRGECVLFHMWTGKLDVWRLDVFYRNMSCYNRLNWSHTHTHTQCQSRFHLDGLHPLINSDGLWNSEVSVWNWRHFTACLVYMFDLTCLNTPQVVGGRGIQSLIRPDRDQLTLLTCLILLVPDGT